MNNVEKLLTLFGSRKALAQAAGVDPAIITRRVKSGVFPASYNASVREAVRYRLLGMPDKEAEAFVAAVEECLSPAVCPTCGHAIEEHRVV